MIADERADHILPPAAQPGNLAVADQVFAVAVVRLAMNEMPDVMQQRGDFKQDAVLRPELVDRAQLIEERKREARDLLGVLRVVVEAARKPPCSGEKLFGAVSLLPIAAGIVMLLLSPRFKRLVGEAS